MKDDTNISDNEEEGQVRGRVNSMRTNLRDLTGSFIETKSRDPSTNRRDVSKNRSFIMKQQPSSNNLSHKEESVSYVSVSQLSDWQEYRNFDQGNL